MADEQPDILSSGPRERARRRLPWPWPWPGRAGPVTLAALGCLLACLGALAYLALQVGQRDTTIGQLRAAVRAARHSASSAAARHALPGYSGSANLTFPDKSGGSFSMVVAAVRPRPGSGPLTWLFVYGQHADPGQRYGLLGDTCGGEYVAPVDWADGTADRQGDLTIVAPNLSIAPRDPNLWIVVYRLDDGTTLGGVKGPLLGGGSKTFGSAPPC